MHGHTQETKIYIYAWNQNLAKRKKNAIRYLRHSLAPSTHSSYSSAQRCFINFKLTYNCLNPNGSPIPSSNKTLMLIATYLTQPQKHQPMKLYLSAIHMMHPQHGLPNPTRDNLCCLMHGIKCVNGKAVLILVSQSLLPSHACYVLHSTSPTRTISLFRPPNY